MYTLKLLLRSYAIHIKSIFEYRSAFLTSAITVVISYAAMYFGIWILMDKFKMIQGWTVYEVMLLFNINLVAYSLTSFAFRTPMLEDIEDMVRMGKFDIVLVRPVNALICVLMGRPTEAYVGQLSLATVIFAVCFNNLDLHWTAVKILFFIITILGATLIQAAIYLILGTLCFFVTRRTSIYETVMGNSRQFINYPISIYGKFLQVILTFIIPFAFVNYYPAYFLLDKNTDVLFHPIFQYGTPVVGIVLFLIAYRFWKIGINRYESTGS
jgi:ABC-2 type transport system permease protein